MKVIHADHGLTEAHFRLIEGLFAGRPDGFLATTVFLPASCGDLPCGLHGPAMGDLPVLSPEVRWGHRGDRANLSRLVERPVRPVRQMAIIGMKEGQEVTLYTAYGGPLSPREITDPTLPEYAAEEALQFWAVHALSLI